MKIIGGFVLGAIVAGTVAFAVYFVSNSPDARLVPAKQVQSYEEWCNSRGGSVHYNSIKYHTGCTVPPKGGK